MIGQYPQAYFPALSSVYIFDTFASNNFSSEIIITLQGMLVLHGNVESLL